MENNPNLTAHPAWHKVQTLSRDLRVFFDPNLDLQSRYITRARLRAIMAHFEVDSKIYRRECHTKHDLIEVFRANLLPIIQPFIGMAFIN